MTQAAYRAATVQLLTECGAAAAITLQVYRGRPASIRPPTAFIDAMSDKTDTFLAPSVFQHTPSIEVICLWGLFDSGEAVDQRDVFVDAFHDYIRTRYHEAGSNTLIGPATLEDVPNYVPDWLPPEQQRTYFATRITLEGFATD